MKIIRFEHHGRATYGQWAGEEGGVGAAWPIEGDPWGVCEVSPERAAVKRLLSPIVPTDILCIGVNYQQHAAETGSSIPQNPMLFIKASNTLNHHGGEIILPGNSAMVDFEAELCVVIGKAARNVPAERALEYVFGYTCANDISARDWQRDKALGGGQFARGKSFDSFCPIGPWIVTHDEIEDPNQLAIKCVVNGQTMQDATTADMIYNVPQLIASLSSTMTLNPGVVILTGTPHGVGMGRSPQVWLKAGDHVAVEIERIGRLENICAKE